MDEYTPEGAGPDPTLEEPTAELEHDEPSSNGSATTPIEPSSIFEDLREAYAEATDERRITIPIVPGRYHGNLAARYRPGPWSDYRKRAERVMRKGGGEEAELRFASQTMAQCVETILYRPADSAELIPMAEASPEWRGGPPVRYDERLLMVATTGIQHPPRNDWEIVRALFRNEAALTDHFVTLDAWLKEAIPSDDEDEDDRVRPT